MFKHELGQPAVDKVSGYKGILNARMEFYKGPIRYYIQGKVGEDGKEMEGYMVDEDAVQIMEGESVERPHDPTAFKYELGSKVKDSITGYKGVISSRTEWLFGCMRYTIQSLEFHEGKPVGPISVDEQAIELIETVQKSEAAPVARTGGTGPKPVQHRKPVQHKVDKR